LRLFGQVSVQRLSSAAFEAAGILRQQDCVRVKRRLQRIVMCMPDLASPSVTRIDVLLRFIRHDI
jgi:hypothetical protein